MLNHDFRDILSALSEKRVEYLLVGAYALAAHGYVRATGDIDLWVHPTPDNAVRVIDALTMFGAPLQSVSTSDFESPDLVFEIGLPPRRIDILTSIDGVSFAEAFANKTVSVIDGICIPVIGLAELIQNKKATARPQDLVDIEILTKKSS